MANTNRIPSKSVEAFTHDEASRRNIPTVEYQSVVEEALVDPIAVAYQRRNRDLDPQLAWRGKDEQDWSDLVVHAPPLYIQEKVQPKALVDELLRLTHKSKSDTGNFQPDLFADFDGLEDDVSRTEFYQHDQNWSNRMILGDSLQVMASLSEREGLRGQVQCVYMDPPYGIKFNSNFQWSTTSRDVKDGKIDHITREPEQVKAYRDTWRDGIHTYLTYLRDRLTVSRDLLCDSGSIFVQISDRNVHYVRALLDEVFGSENFIRLITFVKTTGQTDNLLASVSDYILWYAKDRDRTKFRQPLRRKSLHGEGGSAYNNARFIGGQTRPLTSEEQQGEVLPSGQRVFRIDNLTSQSPGTRYDIEFQGRTFYPKGYWKTQEASMHRLLKADRVQAAARNLYYVRYFDDYAAFPISDNWTDTSIAGFTADKRYVVETSQKVIERCVLMVTDPGDLVLDPTCGSGTTATVSEQWGRRWITIDTSRVALALARARIMGARYPYYLLSDTSQGQLKEAEVSRTTPSTRATTGSIRLGFVYERVPHITLKSIANNAEIEVIWEKWQPQLETLRANLNAALGVMWREWEIPRESESSWPADAKSLHSAWWEARVARQTEIDSSIAARAEFEYLYDRPYEDKRVTRVAGPFTVESLSPHRVVALDENDDLLDSGARASAGHGQECDFAEMILENLKASGVQQSHKDDKIDFTSLGPWPGDLICAEGRYMEGVAVEKKAAVFIGPEFGTVSRPDLIEAAREAADAGFDVLVACAFNYDAHSSDFDKLGRIPVLKARMNADLHMGDDLKNTGRGNLFVIFGEPDIDILDASDEQVRVKINGVDVFHPSTGEVRSDNADGIACWFIDTDYSGESFFVRHAYFLGANDPYKALKTTLKAEIDAEAWESLHSDISRPFDKPTSGRIAVKVINHLGDEVMKVFRVQ